MKEVLGLVIAVFLGALIGLQREYSQKVEHFKRFAGFRTFILITFLGAIFGYLSGTFNSLLVFVGLITIILFSLSSYILETLKFKRLSSTTEIASIFSYVIGVMCTTGYLEFAVVLGILIAAVLAFKEKFHKIIRRMDKQEVLAVIKFGLISFVILPFLPNKNYSPLDIPGMKEIFSGIGVNSSFLGQLNVFNFYHIWLLVILVTGISFVGYFLVKIVGKKRGYGLLGFVGGIISSTAVTLGMAAESKKDKKIIYPFVLATVIATSVMFIRVIFEVAVINNSLLIVLFFPMLVMAVFGFLLAFIFMKRNGEKKKKESLNLKQPFAIGSALKFGLLFVFIILISRIAQLLFGDTGIYAMSILSGLVDVDVMVLTMSSLSKNGEVSNFTATTAIALAAASNTLVKAGIAYFLGNKKFGKVIFGLFLLILLVGGLVLFL